MGKLKSLFIDCSESNHCCDKAQYEEASFLEKLKIRVHIFFCKPCHRYTINNKKLSALVKKANLKTCTEAEKASWKKGIEKEIK